MPPEDDYTPMFQQYMSIKRQHRDSILFFRAGDFYETFFEDAETISKELEIVLTGKECGKGRIPMAGLPYHAIDNYLPRLISRGFRVAICEQMEPPSKAKKIVRREVTRILTPGTLLESHLLDERKNNYIGAVTEADESYGLAYADISTGELKVTQIQGANARQVIASEISRLGITEIILATDDVWCKPVLKETKWADIIPDNITVTWQESVTFNHSIAMQKLPAHFNVHTLEGFGCSNLPLATSAAWALLHYVSLNQKAALAQFNSMSTYHITDYLILDTTVCRNLELTQTIRDASFRGSLLWVIDKTKTSMGGRLLRNWMLRPLISIKDIKLRQDSVEELISATQTRLDIQDLLPQIKDLERIASRIATGTVNARELVVLGRSIEILPLLGSYCSTFQSFLLNQLKDIPDIIIKAGKEIGDMLVENPSAIITDGNIIKNGVNPALDDLRAILGGDKTWVKNLEDQEKEKTGIKSLKINFNKAFGYYIEISNSYKNSVPDYFIRKQTLVNAERYITPELKERESAIFNAEEKIKALEYQLFVELRKRISLIVPLIQDIAAKVSVIDVIASFTETAIVNNYVRPQLNSSNEITIKNSRHPVIEQILPLGSFVPNDFYLNNLDNMLIILTGPNMAGKSTFLRQVGLIVILAQMGSFVPAASASIGITDRIFTRIGAVDDLTMGQSTFMVEMTETANILNNATGKSLILLDEIGRGTSTFDGVSIAWSVSEYIAKNVKARTIFATHYHELNRLSDICPCVKNYQVGVKETADKVIFLYKIFEGGADRSYGIEVARLAGLPGTVISRAKEMLADIERRSRIQAGLQKVANSNGDEVTPIQMSLFNV